MLIRHLHALSALALLLPVAPCALAADDPVVDWFKKAVEGAEITVGEPPPQPSEWRDFNNQFYRLESDGNFSCYSEDGINCKRGERAADPTRIQPLVCGLDHQTKYGITGYDTSSHWCNEVHAKLFAKWDAYHFLGVNRWLSTNANGDVTCLSDDSLNCRGGTRPNVPPQPFSQKVLVCGKAHASVWGISGYEVEHRDHWCQTPSLVAKLDRRFVRGQDADRLTLDLPSWTAADRPTFHIWAFSAQLPKVILTDSRGWQWHGAFPGPHPGNRSVGMVFDFSDGYRWQPVYKAGGFPRFIRFDELPLAADQHTLWPIATAPNRLTLELPGQQQLSGQEAQVEPSVHVWITAPRAKPKI